MHQNHGGTAAGGQAPSGGGPSQAAGGGVPNGGQDAATVQFEGEQDSWEAATVSRCLPGQVRSAGCGTMHAKL